MVEYPVVPAEDLANASIADRRVWWTKQRKALKEFDGPDDIVADSPSGTGIISGNVADNLAEILDRRISPNYLAVHSARSRFASSWDFVRP